MLKKNLEHIILMLIICVSTESNLRSANSGVAQELTIGLTGDHITGYIESRWIAYHKKIDFYYRQFKFSDQLNMHDMHKKFEDYKDAKKVIGVVDDANEVDVNADNTIYIMNLFPENNDVDWENYEFMKMMQKEISPKNPLPSLPIPEGHLPIALHIRRGTSYEFPIFQEGATSNLIRKPEEYDIPEHNFHDKYMPHKMLPDRWYTEMLRYVRNLYPEQPFYVYIFTDDPKPHVFADIFTKALNDPLMVFDYNKYEIDYGAKHYLHNVLEDFFAMMQFDVVIRAQSWFSEMACRLARPKLEISVGEHRWEGRKLVITENIIWTRKDTDHSLTTSEEYVAVNI